MPDVRGARTGAPLEERVSRLRAIDLNRQLRRQHAADCDRGLDRLEPELVSEPREVTNRAAANS